MQQILAMLESPLATLILFGLFSIALILYISLAVRVRRQRRQLRRLLTGTNGENLEAILMRLLDQLDELKEKQDSQQFSINRLSQKVSANCGNLAVLRYNAFEGFGSDLSFSIALLDDQQNGVVITSIYGREESRVYAKPIQAGSSKYHLSEEEQAVLKLAASKQLHETAPLEKNGRESAKS